MRVINQHILWFHFVKITSLCMYTEMSEYIEKRCGSKSYNVNSEFLRGWLVWSFKFFYCAITNIEHKLFIKTLFLPTPSQGKEKPVGGKFWMSTAPLISQAWRFLLPCVLVDRSSLQPVFMVQLNFANQQVNNQRVSSSLSKHNFDELIFPALSQTIRMGIKSSAWIVSQFAD